jgi:hypothetical protein
MKAISILAIAGLAIGAVYFLSKNSEGYGALAGTYQAGTIAGTLDSTSGAVGYEMNTGNYKTVKTLPVVGNSGDTMQSGVRDATRSELNDIQATASKNPSKTIYYPDLGIVTTGGQGFSTATPEKYINTTKAVVTTKAATTTSSSMVSQFNDAAKSKLNKVFL